MPELRTDWLTGRSVFVAENRADRPNEFEPAFTCGEPASARHGLLQVAVGQPAPSSTSTTCPFCAGNETRTPPAVYTHFNDNGRWQLRVVPNIFPAVSTETNTPFEHPNITPALGVHEVIIEAPQHVDRISALSAGELYNVLVAYAERLRHWRADDRFRYGLVFKNQGPRAGASLSHIHSQLIALPDVPAAVQRELDRADQHLADSGRCPYCELIAQERADGRRIVSDQDGFIAFCPLVSLQPLEVWVMPTAQSPWFEQQHDDALFERLAQVLHDVIGKLERLVPGAAYNMLVRTSPWQDANRAARHWRIELLPRVTSLAGLELATNMYINPIPPERAATRLREA